jgi:outer membrane autotransporter protein
MEIPMTKCIGILTSGGDCAGLNATIRAVTLRAHHGYGWKTIGISHGTHGLLHRPVAAEPLDPARLDAVLARQGGTFLGTTNRGNPFAFPMADGTKKDRSAEMVEGLRELHLDGLVGVGGDGSLEILRRLLHGTHLPFIGIPKTIDNDVFNTERAIGYSTAIAIATEALDRLQPTGASHDRVMVLEVMGRDAGHIAIAAGIAGGADIVLIPEVEWHLDRIAKRVDQLRRTGRNSALVVVAQFGFGMSTIGAGNRGVNNGTINVGDDGTGMIGGLFGPANIANFGTINVGACGKGIDTSAGSGSTIVNAGRITASGCGATGVALGAGDTLTNTGVIVGSALGGGLGGSLTGSGGGNTVLNSGTLDGPISLSTAGDNSLTNAGLITISTPLAQTGGVFHTVDGVFTNQASAILALRVGASSAPGAFDSLTVFGTTGGISGTANLGGTLRAVIQPGLYANTTTYSSIVGFTTSTGTFSSVQSTSPFFAAAAVYNVSGVDLVLTRLPFNSTSVIGGGGANTRAIANVLEANYSTSLTGALATFYGNLLVSTSPNTLAQLTGEVTTAPQNAAFGVFGQFLGTVFGQTATSRANGQAMAEGGSSSLARNATTGGGTRTTFALAEECSGDYCDTAPRRVTAWAQGFGGVGSIDGNAGTGASRVDLNTAGGALGVDMQVTPNLIAGVTMGTTSAAFGLSDIASSGTSRSILLGLYGGYSQGPLYVDAALAYGYNTFNTTRAINTGAMSEVAYGAFDGQQYGGRVEGGWRFAIDQHTLTPFAGMTVQALSQAGYSETSRDTTTGAPGVLGVTVQGQTTTSVRSVLGLQFETAIGAADSAVVKPRLRLGWGHEFNTNRSATVALSVLPGAPFQVSGAQPYADSLVVGAGLELELGRMLRVYGQFDGDFTGNARGFSGTGGIRLIW